MHGNLRYDTVYTIYPGEPYVHVETTITNQGTVTETLPYINTSLNTYIAGDTGDDYYYVPGYGQFQFTGHTQNSVYPSPDAPWVAMWDQNNGEGIGLVSTRGFTPTEIRAYDWFGQCACGEGTSIWQGPIELAAGEMSPVFDVYLYLYQGSDHQPVEDFYNSLKPSYMYGSTGNIDQSGIVYWIDHPLIVEP